MVETIDLHDLVTLERRDRGLTLVVDDPSVPAGPSNLAWRAAEALPAPRAAPAGAHITLHKTIPAGAGLGGGSSDAAAVLLGLRRLWRLDLPDGALADIASGLGADVPYFLQGGTALLTGMGTTVTPLDDLAEHQIVLVFPGAVLSTAEVYSRVPPSLTSALKISSMPPFQPTPEGGLPGKAEAWVRTGNDLEPYARALCPSIGAIGERLRAAGALAAGMTGSGSAVFGVFNGGREIETALEEVLTAGFKALRTVPIGRREYRRRVGLE